VVYSIPASYNVPCYIFYFKKLIKGQEITIYLIFVIFENFLLTWIIHSAAMLQSKKDFVHGFSLIKKCIIKIISLRNSAPRLPAGRRKIFAIFALNEYMHLVKFC
jgi:hypothetical protein